MVSCCKQNNYRINTILKKVKLRETMIMSFSMIVFVMRKYCTLERFFLALIRRVLACESVHLEML